MIPDFKTCPKCNINKSKNDFHKRKDKGYIYLKSYCKECSLLYSYDICECGNKKNKQASICKECQISSQTIYHTIGDYIEKYRSKYGNKSSYEIVRSRARQKTKHIKECQFCGYSKHVEVCHIKPISSFDKDTPIDTINDMSNLLILCPNCHWELDNKYRDIDGQELN